MKIKRICKQCGKEFEVYSYKVKEGHGNFCSLKCWGKWKSENLRGDKASNWRGGGIKQVCKVCNKEFETTTCILKTGAGKYCSKECYDKSMQTRSKRICKQCGKEFEVIPSTIEKGNGIFCSRKCSGIAKLGKNNPNWQGGISFEPYCYKFNTEFKEYIRDKFGRVCFLCPKTEEENGRKLDVHHVNYDKNCGCAKTEEDRKADDATCQFVPLCRSCNTKVNHNRKKWEAIIKAKMKNKLNGWFI